MVPIVESIIILVMSFNIRYANPNDGLNNWDNRKNIVISLIHENSPDIVGFQDVRGTQLRYLDEKLGSYNSFGRSRSENPNDEHSSIFYNKNKFELIDSSTFWLSETPEKPSKGWDAASVRIATWGKFKHKETGKVFFLFNTHFDNVGEAAKLESIKLLRKKVKEISGKQDYIVTGDFNISPSTHYYNLLTSKDTSMAYFADVSQFNAQIRANIKGTYNGFDKNQKLIGPIDYIFVKPTVSVDAFSVVDKLFNGRFPSDHFPIQAELKLKAE